MPATAALPVSTAIAPSSAATRAGDVRGSADAGRAFDSHLDAARQQHDSHTAPAAERADDAQRASKRVYGQADTDTAAAQSPQTTQAAPAKTTQPAADAPIEDGSTTTAKADDGSDGGIVPEAVSVAGAMLALLGQAAPAAASIVTGGAAKVMAATVLKAALGKPGAAADATAAAPGGDPAGAHTDGAIAAAAAAADAPAGKDVSALADVFAAGLSASSAHKPSPGDGPQYFSDLVSLASGPSGDNKGGRSFAPGDKVESGTSALADVFAAGLSKAAPQKSLDGHALQDLAPLSAAMPQPTANTGVMPPHALQIASPAGSAGFAQELGQQVAWLGGQDIKQAKIRLHPEELGQVDVSVRMQHGGQVDVTFAAQHPAAVHALQQTLPQLDALLAQHGLSLGQANVGQQQSGGDGKSGSGFAGQGDTSEAGESVVERPSAISAVGLLDAFA